MCDRVDVSLADDPHVQVLNIQHSKHENDDLVDGLINDLNDELDDQDDQYIIENSSSAAGTDEECWQDRIVDTDLESLIDIDLTAIDDSDVDSVAGHIACHSARDNNNNDDNDNGPGDDNVTASTTNPTNNDTNNVTYNVTYNATYNATNNPNRHATVEKNHDPLEDTRRSEYADQISKEVKACADRYAYRTACSLEDLIGLLPSNEELWS
jgi:hypothetical protein